MPLLPLIVALHASFASFLPLEQQMAIDVLAELNSARTDPVSYARSLRTYRGYYRDRVIVSPTTANRYLTVEGVAPVDEAITFVVGRSRRLPLSPAIALAAAARDHQLEQQRNGTIGHYGLNDTTPSERVRRRSGDLYVGEIIAYGSVEAVDVVRQLIVDDGVADRGHRVLIFDDSIRYAGVSCGTHPVYRHMCVITVARTKDGRPLAG